MTTTADTTTRANRKGDPCPSWCTVDHETPSGSGHRYEFHGGQTARIEVPGELASIPDLIYVRPISDGQPGYGEQNVSLNGTMHGIDHPGPNAWLPPREALHVADLIEMLAKASPARHRELAAAIRKAAADIAATGA